MTEAAHHFMDLNPTALLSTILQDIKDKILNILQRYTRHIKVIPMQTGDRCSLDICLLFLERKKPARRDSGQSSHQSNTNKHYSLQCNSPADKHTSGLSSADCSVIQRAMSEVCVLDGLCFRC